MADSTTELEPGDVERQPPAPPDDAADPKAAQDTPGEQKVAPDPPSKDSSDSGKEAAPAPPEEPEKPAASRTDEQGQAGHPEIQAVQNVLAKAIGTGDTVPILLSDRFLIHSDRPLPALDSPSTRAFQAEDRSDPDHQLYAVVTAPGVPARTEDFEDFVGQEIPGLLPFVDYGTVTWPPLGREVLILIYERPLGGRVQDYLKEVSSEYRRQDIVRGAIEAVFGALQHLGTMETAHRAVRPENVYFKDEERKEVILGEFLSSPPGFDQPYISEPIERAMADPSGRGWGGGADDLFALGIVLAIWLLGRNPVAHMEPRQLILSRLTVGSYQTVTAGARFVPALLEPLRGLLADAPSVRWGFEQMDLWLNGRRVSPTQGQPTPKSQRGLTFGNFEHFTARTLAYSMSLDRAKSLELLFSSRLEQWISRGLEIKELAASVATAVQVGAIQKAEKPEAEDLMLAKVLMLLDPAAPIRYKGRAFLPDGFGSAMALEMLQTRDAALTAEAMDQELLTAWYKGQETLNRQQHLTQTVYEKLTNHLKRSGPGFGAERCLYELNPGLPCLSDVLLNRYVTDAKNLLFALNDAGDMADENNNPLDRHISAYLATHYEAIGDRYLAEVGDPDETVSLLAVLKLFAALQDRIGPESLPGLSSWIGKLLPPVVGTYQSRAARQQLESQLPKLVAEGALTPILRLLDNAELQRRDKLEFEAAVEAFRLAEEEIHEIENRSEPGSEIALRRARQTAATISTLIMGFVILMILFAG